MILLVGASASGKTEIAKYLRTRYGMVKAITHTTRAMRVGERQDVDYHFVSKDEFLRLKGEAAFVERTSKATRESRMTSRGDDPEAIAKRLEGDEKTFDEATLPPIDYFIDAETKSVAELGDAIYALYQQRLTNH